MKKQAKCQSKKKAISCVAFLVVAIIFFAGGCTMMCERKNFFSSESEDPCEAYQEAYSKKGTKLSEINAEDFAKCDAITNYYISNQDTTLILAFMFYSFSLLSVAFAVSAGCRE